MHLSLFQFTAKLLLPYVYRQHEAVWNDSAQLSSDDGFNSPCNTVTRSIQTNKEQKYDSGKFVILCKCHVRHVV